MSKDRDAGRGARDPVKTRFPMPPHARPALSVNRSTLGIGCNASAPRRVPGPGSRVPASRGFTLLEMIVVMLIIAMMASLLGTSVVGRMDSVKVATAARDLTAALRYTRSQAVLHRQEQFLELNLETKSYVAAGQKSVQLPESMELKLLTAQSEVSSDKVGRIRFFADGGSTGGRVTLISGGREWKVKVSWLTGEITMDDGRGERRL